MEAIPIILYFPNIIYCSLAVLIVTLIALYYYVETSRVVCLVKKLPGPTPIPIIGHVLYPLILRMSPEKIIPKGLEYRDIYGPVGGGYFGTKVVVILADPQDIEIILSNPAHNDKAEAYELFQPWLGDGLLITTGDKWRRHRKIIAPTFHMSILKTFVPLFYENSMDLVRRLRDEIGKEFDCHDYLSAVTVDILTETAMGVRREKRQKTGYDYAVAVMKMSDILHRRHYDFSLYYDITFKFTKFAKKQKKLLNIIHTLTNHVIEEKSKDIEEKLIKDQQQKEVQNSESMESLSAIKKEGIDKNNATKYTKLHYVRDDLDVIDENDVGEKKRLAFLEMMLDLKRNGCQMTDEEIRDEVNTIMFEGHDTTAAGSSFALCVLGYHQDIQARVHEELDAIFGDSDRQCTFQDTLEMKYFERVILETLRLFPPVPAIARKLNEDVKIITGNYILPKTASVLIPQFAVHRSEKYYPNPSVFNPDNFLPEKMQQRHYYAFIPFSAGPRFYRQTHKISPLPFPAAKEKLTLVLWISCVSSPVAHGPVIVGRSTDTMFAIHKACVNFSFAAATGGGLILCVRRSCVGRKYAMLKLKVLLSTILRNYRVISDVADKDFILRADIILKRHDGFNIKIEPRKPVSCI